MPMKPKKPCKHPGCPLLTADTYCEFHIKLHANDRASAHERGYSSQWQKARKEFLQDNRYCKLCQTQGKQTLATIVDHIKPHRGDQTLFWDKTNWQPLCKKCHDRKTQASERYPLYQY